MRKKNTRWTVYPNPIDLNTTSISNIKDASTFLATRELTIIENNEREIKTYLKESSDEKIGIADNLISGIYYLTDDNQTVSISVLR